MNRWTPIALLIMLTIAPRLASAEIIDRIAARVNNEIVTLHDVRQAAIPFLLQSGQDPAILDDPNQRDAVLKEALEELVDRRLLVQEAEKIDYKVSDEELDRWLEFTRKQQNLNEEEFKGVIEQYGMPYTSYREMVRQNLLKVRMIKIKVGSQVTVSEADVDAMYQKEFGAAGGQERYLTLRHILLQPADASPQAIKATMAKAEKLRQRILAGEDFAEVAKKNSQGPSAPNGGVLGAFKRGELDPDFESTAFAAKIGVPTPPVQTKFGVHIIEVMGEELKASADDEQKREQIRAAIQQKEMDRLLKQYMSQLRTRSFVEIHY